MQRSRKGWIWALLIALCAPMGARADLKSAKGRPLYADIFLFSGYSQASRGVDLSLAQGGIGISAAYVLGGFFLMGGASDVRGLAKLSQGGGITGNYGGLYINGLSPWIGAIIQDKAVIKLEARLIARYSANGDGETMDLSDFSLEDPAGARVMTLFSLGKGPLLGGAVFEYLKYGNTQVVDGALATSNPLNLWMTGAMLAYPL